MSDEHTTGPAEDGASPPWEEPKKRKVIISDTPLLDEAIENTKADQLSEDFQSALFRWRRFAHGRGLIVASPICLAGRETTFFGDSDDLVVAEHRYTLQVTNKVATLGKVRLNDKERELLGGLESALDTGAEWDVRNLRAPETNPVPLQDDERSRWNLGLSDKHVLGTVVRTGEGPTKRYMLFLWKRGWHLQDGAPPYDLPMFGRGDLGLMDSGLPVMIHEGPKAWEAAKDKLPGYVHVAWHAAEAGIEWTDWTPLTGRDVLIWSDCDDAGVRTAQSLALHIARLGGVVSYMNWSAEDLAAYPRWDWADEGGLSILNARERAERIIRVESPVLVDGRLNPDWLSRSYLDLSRREVYQISNDYTPLALDTLAIGQGKGFKERLVKAAINPFRGLDYRPGRPPGKLKNGKINLYRPLPPIEPREPSKRLRRLYWKWLAKMVPDRIQRVRLVARIVLAVMHPERVPQHMIVLRGESGVGKSLLLQFIAQAVGGHNSVELVPEDVFSKFNDRLVHKYVACLHEIHSEDVTRKQNTHRLKELIANKFISVEAKNRPRIQMTNVIHWFGATNEDVPVILAHGNNRFYFVNCVMPLTKNGGPPFDLKREAVPLLEDEAFMDEFRSACAWLITHLKPKVLDVAVGRARRQDVWEAMEEAARPGWAQEVDDLMELFEESKLGAFFADQVINKIKKRYPRLPPNDIRNYLSRKGYKALIRKDGKKVIENKRGRDCGVRMTFWSSEARYDELMKMPADKIKKYIWVDGDDVD